MTTTKDRDRLLHNLYCDRNFLVFANGQQWFEQQVNQIHWDWPQSGTWIKITDLDIDISRVCWELDNGYCEDAE